MNLPPWVILHVPHDSVVIPPEVREQFVLSDHELAGELDRWTDHHTFDLFVSPEYAEQAVRARVSRLVVDVERFAEDRAEPNAQHGWGAVYTRTAEGARLRRDLLPAEREALIQNYYVPHHAKLAEKVAAALAGHGRCLVIDCHSFPDRPLPHENAQPGEPRPDICIGTDAFHTSPELRQVFVEQLERVGWSVHVDSPFAGALVPAECYGRDPRVGAIMVEVHRSLYLDEPGAQRVADFAWVSQRLQAAIVRAIGFLQPGDAACETLPQPVTLGPGICRSEPADGPEPTVEDDSDFEDETDDPNAPPTLLEQMVEEMYERWRKRGIQVIRMDPSDQENPVVGTLHRASPAGRCSRTNPSLCGVASRPVEERQVTQMPIKQSDSSWKVLREPNPYWEFALKELDQILKDYPHTDEDLEPQPDTPQSVVTFVSRAPTWPSAQPSESQAASP